MQQTTKEENLPDYINWYLRSRGLIITPEKKSKKIEPIEEPEEIKKAREQEQTQKLLIALADELFNQIQEIHKNKEYHEEDSDPFKVILEKKSETNQSSKIEFTDISWFSKKLDGKSKK